MIDDRVRAHSLLSLYTHLIIQDYWLSHVSCAERSEFAIWHVTDAKLATSLIAYKFMDRWRATLMKNYISRFLLFIQTAHVRPSSGLIFEREAHNVLLKC